VILSTERNVTLGDRLHNPPLAETLHIVMDLHIVMEE
jgi:hypothetical protein